LRLAPFALLAGVELTGVGVGASEGDVSVPAEMRCAINGHVMTDPVRTPQGMVFERGTIELWLKTRGQVCPLTHEPLTLGDLVPAQDLRLRILQWHIHTVSLAQKAALTGDSVYDF
jgi:hypothetical protein